MPKEIPVYIFTGFLESGKTLFMQDTLEDSRFNAGEKTLVLQCEEGEEEFDPAKFPSKNVVIKTLDSQEDLNESRRFMMKCRRDGSHIRICCLPTEDRFSPITPICAALS